jgi:hypothetical protein
MTTTVVRKEMAVIPKWAIILAAIEFISIPVLFYTVVWGRRVSSAVFSADLS